MKVEKQDLTFHGHRLHRLILHPKSPPCGTLLFFHGQGDFIDRYPSLLELFVHQGWQCYLTDLPGHGRSSGKRGHVPGFSFIDQLVDELPLQKNSIICGHSMGGMLALRELLRRPQHYRAGWFSSPLLAPARQASALMKLILPLVADYFPWLTRSTGVRAEDCSSESRKLESEPPLYHGSISLGWARELVNYAEELKAQWLKLPTDKPLLFTQGSADPVCPADILKERLIKQSSSQTRYCELAGALHEPFHGESAAEFHRLLEAEIPRLTQA